MLIGLLIRIVIIHNHTKCIPLSNPKCMTQPNLIDLHPNEYSQEIHHSLLRLNWIDVSEVVILLLIYLIKHVFQTKQKIYMKVYST